jgi:ribosomal protein S18 acetylase RimI-like enzyme
MSGAALGRDSRKEPPVDIDLLRPEEWADLRDIRMRSLLDAPDAFIVKPSRVAAWSEHDWLSTFESGIWAVARAAEQWVGLARSSRDERAPRERHIEAVWVDPGHRRAGVASRLVRALVDLELRSGAAEILLWIVAGNEAARSFYERIGFRPTGERQPIPGDEGRVEERLRLVAPPKDVAHQDVSPS